VAARRGDFEGAFDVLLADDIREIRAAVEVGRRLSRSSSVRFDGHGAEEMRREARQRRHRVYLDARDEGCLDGVRRGHEGALLPVLARESDHRQDAVDAAQFAIEREFADENGVFEVRDELAAGSEKADGDGEVVRRAFLAQVSRGRIDLT